MDENNKQNETIFDFIWSFIKATAAIFFLFIVAAIIVLIGILILPAAIFVIPIIFIACLLVLLK